MQDVSMSQITMHEISPRYMMCPYVGSQYNEWQIYKLIIQENIN